MRRILFSAGWYAAGLVTIPLLMLGVDAVSARGVGYQASSDTAWSPQGVGQARVSTCQKSALPTACGSHHSFPALTDALVSSDAVFADDAPAVDFSQSSVEIAQAERIVPRIAPDTKAAEDRPFEEARLNAAVPQREPAVTEVILPVTPEMLATGAAKDEAEAAKLTELRDALKKVIEEKAAMLSATALETEIALHQRHLADLQALQELLKLQQSLKELSDKYPNSDAGRRAGEMLELLNQQRRGSPLSLQPTPDPQPHRRTRSVPGDTFDAPLKPTP